MYVNSCVYMCMSRMKFVRRLADFASEGKETEVANDKK